MIFDIFFYLKLVCISIPILVILYSFIEKNEYKMQDFSVVDRIKIFLYMKNLEKIEDKNRAKYFRLPFQLLVIGVLMLALLEWVEKLYAGK